MNESTKTHDKTIKKNYDCQFNDIKILTKPASL